MQAIWRENNNYTFNGVKQSMAALKSSCVKMLIEWSLTLGPNDMHPVIYFINFLSFSYEILF